MPALIVFVVLGLLFSAIGCPLVLHFSVTSSSDSSTFDLANFVSTTSSFAVRDALIFSGSLTFFSCGFGYGDDAVSLTLGFGGILKVITGETCCVSDGFGFLGWC